MDFGISVVIPIYNAASTIVQAINSVLNQKYAVSEIILVNDGSIDNSLELIASSYEELIANGFITIINKTNEGPSIARNMGVAIAKYEWIAFLDSDDLWEYEKLAVQVNCLANNPMFKICGTGSNISNFNPQKQELIISYRMLLFKNYFATSSVMIQKSIYLECGGFNKHQKFCEDYNLWLDILSLSGGGIVINQHLLIYNTRGDGKLSMKLEKMLGGEIRTYKQQATDRRINFILLRLLIVISYFKYLVRKVFK